MNFEMANFNLVREIKESAKPQATVAMDTTTAREEYKNILEESLLENTPSTPNISPRLLSFKEKSSTPNPAIPVEASSPLRLLYNHKSCRTPTSPKVRKISPTPEKVLDAPEIVDDYYLNLLDWNKDNLLAVALKDTVYLWNAGTGCIKRLVQTEDPENIITSVSFSADGSYISVGTAMAEVQIWDVEHEREVRTMGGHMARVSALSWNAHLVSSGSRDSLIINHDIRVARHHVSTMEHHTQEVCGLRWSPDGTQLASGSNDNLLNIWDLQTPNAPRYTFNQHNAAVKALAWCPFQQNMLASGGGTADRTIRFWNTKTGACINSVDTKSQVCALQWSKHTRELVSSHGFSQNQLIVWSYPTMTKLAELTGHSSRVLHMATSPDGSTVVSAAGDETLRFWRIFDVQMRSPSIKTSTTRGNIHRLDIR